MTDFFELEKNKGLYGALFQKLISFSEKVGSDDDNDGNEEMKERMIFYQIFFNVLFVLFLGVFWWVWKKKPADED